jgi:hypothetical protein
MTGHAPDADTHHAYLCGLEDVDWNTVASISILTPGIRHPVEVPNRPVTLVQLKKIEAAAYQTLDG